MKVLDESFFHKDCLQLAPLLVGKLMIRTLDDGSTVTLRITETESYRGEDDTACHASKGRTARTDILYRKAGTIYVYLCYGMHWLFNIVTGEEDVPQAVLIRACKEKDGPAKLTKALSIDKSFNGESIIDNKRLCIADDGYRPQIITDKRVGIDYADKEDIDRLWRFIDADSIKKGKRA